MTTTETNHVPNLDAMSADALMQFWAKHQHGRCLTDLFPQGGAGTKRATWDLANYASNKATAMGLRLRGEIPTAVIYEAIADSIYRKLPEWARW